MEFCKSPEISLSHAGEEFTAVNFNVAIMQLISKSLTDINNSQRRRETRDLDVASYDIGISIVKIHQIYSDSENNSEFNAKLCLRRALC